VKSLFVLVIGPRCREDACGIRRTRRKTNPPLTYGSIGAGSVQHMSMEFAKKRLGFDATHVPYRSTPSRSRT
jgi:hypothetical protein